MTILGILWSVHKAGGSCRQCHPVKCAVCGLTACCSRVLPKLCFVVMSIRPPQELRDKTGGPTTAPAKHRIYAAVIASHQRSLHPAKTIAKPSKKTTMLILSETDHPGSPLSHRCTSTCRWGCNYPEQRHDATRRIESKSPPCLASEVFVVAICSTCL